MDNYSQTFDTSQKYFLSFRMYEHGSFFLDSDLPTPNRLNLYSDYITFMYVIDGFFSTAKGKEFLSDIVSRFYITFKNNKIERMPYEIKAFSTTHTHEQIYKLKDFQNLKSLTKEKNKSDYYKQLKSADCKDNCFWALKYQAEHHIRNYGLINFDEFQKWAFDVFKEKEPSTLRAKCRSIFNWYHERDFELSNERTKTGLTLKEYNMTEKHQKHLNQVADLKRNRTQEKIVGAVAQLRFSGKKINIANVQKITKISRPTIMKYKDLFVAGSQMQFDLI